MGRRVINCIVKDEYVQGAGVMVGAAGSHDDVVLRLEFEEMWEGTTKTITWLDALGGNPTLTTLTANMLETGTTNVYLVPIPGEPKAYPGKMTMTIKGVTVSGTTEITATLSVAAWFTVAESFWDADAQESADVTPTQAEQLQAEIDDVLDDIENIQTHAADAEAWAVGERDGQPVTEGDDTWHNNAKYYAQQAGGSADAAAGSAGDASDYATAANNAKTAAVAAQGYAEAAQTAAETAQGLAEDAQTAAETAQGKAEDAQEAAETAQGKAEDAQEAAELAATVTAHPPIIGDNGDWYVWDATAAAYVDSGSSSIGEQGPEGPEGPEGPQGVPGEVTLEQLATAFPTDTASGNPATFADGADNVSVKSLVATIPFMPYEIKPGWFLNESANYYRVSSSGSVSPRTIVFKAKPSTAYTITSGIPGTMRVIATAGYPLLGTGYSNRAKATDNDNPVSVSITTTALQTWIMVQFFIEDDVTYRSATIEAALAGWSTSPVLSFGGLTITANGETVTADWSAQGDICGGTVDFTNGVVTGTVDSTGAELDPPVVYNIDPIPVASIYGNNTISSEVGSLALNYRADTALYVQKKIAEVTA